MKKTRRIAAFIAAMAMAATMAAPTMMNASAADVNIKVQTDGKAANEVTTITPDKDNATHTYTAYQIFTGEYKLKPGKEEGSENPEDYEFKVTGLGSDATTLLSNAAFLDFSAGEGKPTVREAIGSATGAAAAIAAAQALDGIVDGSPKAQELADILAAAITTGGTALTTDGKDFAEGYYLVKDTYTANATDGVSDAVSKFILRVNSKKDADGITIIPKKSYPEVIKKVQENAKSVLNDWVNSGTATTLEGNVTVTDKWNDVADYNIGDSVPFQLYGSMPETLADYTGYYYEFSDNLATQFNQPQTVTVAVEGTTLAFTWNSANNAYELTSGYLSARTAADAVTGTVYTMKGDATFKTQVDTVFGEVAGWDTKTEAEKAQYLYEHWSNFATDDVLDGAYKGETVDKWVTKEDDVIITPAVTARTEDKSTDGNCRVTWTAGSGATPGTLSVTFENIKAYDSVDKDTVVTVNYSAVLNDTAVIGLDGQENTVKLIYSNNPNVKYTPDTEDNTDQGATHKTGNTEDTPVDKVVVFTYELDINKIDGSTKKPLQGAKFKLSNGTKWAVVDTTTGKLTGWADTEAGGTELVSGADGLFKIIGIDSGSYTLKETAAPEGYNPPANPNFAVTLTATTVNTQQYTSATYNDATKVLEDIAGKINTADMTKLGAVTGVRGENGGLAGTIKNNKGTTLPSTGGMGTKAFVAGGGLTALLAGVWLATKKRMGKED